MVKRTAGEAAIPALPNRFPYNELLLMELLSAKSRSWYWSHTGLTLLYTSTGTEKVVANAHGFDWRCAPRKVIVGVGELLPVRPFTRREVRQFERECGNGRDVGITAFPWRFEFTNLKRFRTPVPFQWPSGAITTCRVPISVVASALKEVGVSI